MLIVKRLEHWRTGEVFSNPETVVSITADGPEYELVKSIDQALDLGGDGRFIGSWVTTAARTIAKELARISPHPAQYDNDMQSLFVKQARETKDLFQRQAKQRSEMEKSIHRLETIYETHS